MNISLKSKQKFNQGRFIFMAGGSEVKTEDPPEAPKDKNDLAKQAVNDALNKDVSIVLDTNEKNEKPILNEQQIKMLKERGVGTVQVEKDGQDLVTRLYFDSDVTVQVRQGAAEPRDYIPRKMAIDHDTTVGITLIGREEPNADPKKPPIKVTDIILDNKDGSRDIVTIRKKM